MSTVVARHPEWLILDAKGRHARTARRLATLCPAVPEVREYLRTLTERFVREWGFDGHKLDNIFTVPPCYNPAHHHRTPDASIQAVGEAYKVIFETTRALKPDSVTQICPCGTPPNVAWLPYMDQAVTADPVGPRQIRQRIKMYKALLGPEAAVYGDHVELSEMSGWTRTTGSRSGGTSPRPSGRAGSWERSSRGPTTAGSSRPSSSTPRRKPTGRSGSASTTRAAFRAGRSWTSTSWATTSRRATRSRRTDGCTTRSSPRTRPRPGRGDVELRGLKPGRYAVRDPVEGTDLGVVDAARPFLTTSFTHHLLLEATPVP